MRASGRRLALAILLALTLMPAAPAEARPWAWLGVRIRDLSEQEMDAVAVRHGIREGFGVVIVDVMEDTPAARAGIKAGDIVVAFEGRPVVDTRMLQRLIAGARTDREVRITVLRQEGRRPLGVTLVGMPRAVAGERIAAEFGFLLREPPAPGETPASGAPPAAVGAVLRGGPAEKAGLEVGDGLLQVNDQPVITRDAAREALADADPARPLRLIVRRGDRHVSLTLEAAERS